MSVLTCMVINLIPVTFWVREHGISDILFINVPATVWILHGIWYSRYWFSKILTKLKNKEKNLEIKK